MPSFPTDANPLKRRYLHLGQIEDLHEGASKGCLGACALWRGDAQPAGHPIKCWANMWEEKKKDLLAAYVTFMVRIHPLVRVSAPILAPR